MEEKKQPPSPIITEVVAWLMIIFGIVIIPFSLFISFCQLISPGSSSASAFYGGLLFSLLGILLIILAIFLFRKKKWAWMISAILSFLLMIYTIITAIYNPSFLMITAIFGLIFGFFLIDRKNFWKIAT